MDMSRKTLALFIVFVFLGSIVSLSAVSAADKDGDGVRIQMITALLRLGIPLLTEMDVLTEMAMGLLILMTVGPHQIQILQRM